MKSLARHTQSSVQQQQKKDLSRAQLVPVLCIRRTIE